MKSGIPENIHSHSPQNLPTAYLHIHASHDCPPSLVRPTITTSWRWTKINWLSVLRNGSPGRKVLPRFMGMIDNRISPFLSTLRLQLCSVDSWESLGFSSSVNVQGNMSWRKFLSWFWSSSALSCCNPAMIPMAKRGNLRRECFQEVGIYCVLPCKGMPTCNSFKPPPVSLSCIDKKEVGQALDVVEEDHQVGELTVRKTLKADKKIFHLYVLFIYNLANM